MRIPGICLQISFRMAYGSWRFFWWIVGIPTKILLSCLTEASLVPRDLSEAPPADPSLEEEGLVLARAGLASRGFFGIFVPPRVTLSAQVTVDDGRVGRAG